jgi:hypothetical protein
MTENKWYNKFFASILIKDTINNQVNNIDSVTLNNPSAYPEAAIYGTNLFGMFGYSVAGVGDINKDGIDDMVVGVGNNINGTGAAYIIYGSENGLPNITSIEDYLNDASKGAKIYIPARFSYASIAVSTAGDINADGIDDIILGDADGQLKPFVNNPTGAAYIIYGSKSRLPNEISVSSYLNDISKGFKIYGSNQGGNLGYSVSNAGDVNADGVNDIILSEMGAYVIYGSKGGLPNIFSIDDYLNDTSKGFKIQDLYGYSVSSAGDINADGMADIIMGLCAASPYGLKNAGAAYTVYGIKGGLPNIDSVDSYLNDISKGFKTYGSNPGDCLGYSVSNVGDVNADGIDDIILGGPQFQPPWKPGPGKSYIIYGSKDGLPNIAFIEDYLVNTSKGFKIHTSDPSGALGASVSGAGDINKDGIDDIVIGASEASPNGINGAGTAYILYGNKDFPNILSIENYLNDTSKGFKLYGSIDAENTGSNLGNSVHNVGDVNNDSIADIMIGMSAACIDIHESGGAYIVYGRSTPLPTTDDSSVSSNEYLPYEITGGVVGGMVLLGCVGGFLYKHYYNAVPEHQPLIIDS